MVDFQIYITNDAALDTTVSPSYCHHTQLKSDSLVSSSVHCWLSCPVGFPRIRYLMHDITGGHEKLQLLYLLCASLFRRPLGQFSLSAILRRGRLLSWLRASNRSTLFHFLFSVFFFLATHDAGVDSVQSTQRSCGALSGALLHSGMHMLQRYFSPLHSSSASRFSFFLFGGGNQV
jgi:hypothetical protein